MLGSVMIRGDDEIPSDGTRQCFLIPIPVPLLEGRLVYSWHTLPYFVDCSKRCDTLIPGVDAFRTFFAPCQFSTDTGS